MSAGSRTLKLQKVCLLHVPHSTFTHTVQLLGELHRSRLVSVFARMLGNLGLHFSVIMIVFATFSTLIHPNMFYAPIFRRCTSTWVITTWQQKGRLFSFLQPAAQGVHHFPLDSQCSTLPACLTININFSSNKC